MAERETWHEELLRISNEFNPRDFQREDLPALQTTEFKVADGRYQSNLKAWRDVFLLPGTPERLSAYIEIATDKLKTIALTPASVHPVFRRGDRDDARIADTYLSSQYAVLQWQAFDCADKIWKVDPSRQHLPDRTDDSKADLDALRNWCITASGQGGLADLSPVAAEHGKDRQEEILALKPEFCGISLDLKALWKVLWRWFSKHRTMRAGAVPSGHRK